MSESHRCPQCGVAIPVSAPAGLCPKCLVQAGFESNPLRQPRPGPTVSSPASSAFEPPTVAELADKFPQLEILELLGKGGMGAVYKARQRALDRPVALKILPPEIGQDAAFAERFTREARALARLSHNQIVSVYDFGATSNPQAPSSGSGVKNDKPLFYIVMEYVDGVNLRQTIESGGLSPKHALAIVPQICEALQYAHDEGIVHRDIKPENILVDKRGRVKIADFGLAKLLGRDGPAQSLTSSHQVMGSVRYMAPEQMEASREVDHRADIYSLGVVFYEMLTGELPLGRFAPPSAKVTIDVRLDDVVLRSLEKEPERRYQQVSEVKTDLENISRSTRSSPHVAAAPAQPRPLPGMVKFALGMTIVLAVIAGFIAARQIFQNSTASSPQQLPELDRDDSLQYLTELDRDDSTNLQGTWIAVAGERDGGTPLSSEELAGVKVAFDHDQLRVAMRGRTDEGKFKLDRSQRPKRIAVTRVEGPNRFGIMDGIYKLDGDHLRICMGEPEDRPTEFKSRPGSRLLTLDLVRQSALGPIAIEAITGQLVQTGQLSIARLGEFDVTFPRPFAGSPTFIFPREAFDGPGHFVVQQSSSTGFKIEVTSAAFTPQQPVRIGWLATGQPAPPANPQAVTIGGTRAASDVSTTGRAALPENPQQDTIVWGTPSPNGMQLGIEADPDKSDYLVGDVMKLRLFLRNSSTQAIRTTWPRLEVLEKFGFNLSVSDAEHREVAWAWGKGHKPRELLTVSGAIALTLARGQIHELLVAEILMGKDTLSATATAVLDVEPGQSYGLKCTLDTYSNAKDEGEPLESGVRAFRVVRAEEPRAPQSSAGAQELDRLVELTERELQRVKQLVERHAAPSSAADDAEVKAIDARVRRDQARQDWVQVVSQLRRLVEIREAQLKRIDALVKAHAVPTAELDEAEIRLIEARLRYKEAEAALHSAPRESRAPRNE